MFFKSSLTVKASQVTRVRDKFRVPQGENDDPSFTNQLTMELSPALRTTTHFDQLKMRIIQASVAA